MIGQFCTCDIDNFGDLLYPVIFRKILEKYGHNDNFSAFGFLEGAAPCGSDFFVHDIKSVLKKGKRSLSHLVIGGGDILRTDTAMLASHYNGLIAKRLRRSLASRIKNKLFSGSGMGHDDMNRLMGNDAVGPFLVDKGRYPNVETLIYFSCGVPFVFKDSEKKRVKKAIESAAYVCVRDEQSRKKLVDAGVSTDIDIAPDLITVLSDFFDYTEERKKGTNILKRHGVNIERAIICVQSHPQAGTAEEEFTKALYEMSRLSNAEIVLMPIGFCHNDDIFLRRIANNLGNQCKYIEAHSIYEMISVIATSKVFVGTSMHGNVTAFSYGIPHLFGPIAVDKAEGFLDIVRLGSDFRLASWGEVTSKMKMLDTLSPDHFASLAEAAKKDVYRALDKVAAVLSSN